MIDPARPDFTNTPSSSHRARYHYAPATESPPHVSIVTPFFNAGCEFAETATTVFRQSLQQWEWIIVNDGSSNAASMELLEAYRTIDPRVRVIEHAVNRGLSAARNTGFEAARSPLVLQLDADDLLEPTAAEKWSWYLDAHPATGFVKGYTVGFGAQQYLWNRGFHDGPVFLERNLVNPTAMIRRSVHEAAGGYDGANRGGLSDWEFWLRCARAGHWGATVPEHLDWYRRRADHSDRWSDFDEGPRQREFGRRLRREFAELRDSNFPVPPRYHPSKDERVPDEWPCENALRKEKQRLLLVVPWYAMGGADKANLDVVEQLTRHGWEVSVASTVSSEDQWLSRFAAWTPDVFALHRFLRAVDYPRFLAYLIQSRGIDTVVLSHSDFGYRLLPWLRSRFPHVTFVDSLHVVEPTWSDGGYPAFSVQYREQLDLSVAASENVRQWMVERGADHDRVEVCHINVDATAIQPDATRRAIVRRELGVSDETPVILFVGRICSQKQPAVLADTFRRLKDASVDFEGWVVGDGPDLEMLRATLRAHGLMRNVRLLGELPHVEAMRLMTAADVLFLPSKYEGIALVLFEAMAAGLPVLGADVGGQRELVTNDCGFLIVSSDPKSEADEYARLLSGPLADPAIRRSMGRAGRIRVASDFTLDRMGTRMIELLDRAACFRRSQPRPALRPGITRAHVALAVELARMSLVVDGVRRERERERAHRGVGGAAHAVLSRWFAPIHRWSVARGWMWIPMAGLRARRFLLRENR